MKPTSSNEGAEKKTSRTGERDSRLTGEVPLRWTVEQIEEAAERLASRDDVKGNWCDPYYWGILCDRAISYLNARREAAAEALLLAEDAERREKGMPDEEWEQDAQVEAATPSVPFTEALRQITGQGRPGRAKADFRRFLLFASWRLMKQQGGAKRISFEQAAKDIELQRRVDGKIRGFQAAAGISARQMDYYKQEFSIVMPELRTLDKSANTTRQRKREADAKKVH